MKPEFAKVIISKSTIGRLFVAVTLLWLFSHLTTNAQDINNMASTKTILDTAAAAKEKAIKFTGFTAAVKSADEVVIKESDIPFLADKVVGRSAWQIKFAPFMLNLKSEMNATDSYQRDFEVLLDKETGQLISIKSRFSGALANGQKLLPPVNRLEAEKQLASPDGPLYTGFPTSDPKLTFMEVLEAIGGEGGNLHPYKTVELSAIYVVMHDAQQVPFGDAVAYARGLTKEPKTDFALRSVWVIGLRGITGAQVTRRRLQPEPGEVPRPVIDDQLDYLTETIDATTGKRR